MEFDYEKLRRDLIDFYGTASIYNLTAILDVGLVESASENELLMIAQNNGLDLSNYIKSNGYKRIK